MNGQVRFPMPNGEAVATLDPPGRWSCPDHPEIEQRLNDRLELLFLGRGPALGDPLTAALQHAAVVLDGTATVNPDRDPGAGLGVIY